MNNKFQKIYTTLGSSRIFIACPCLVHGQPALCYVKNNKVEGAVLMKDIYQYFKHIDKLPKINLN